MKTKYKLWLRPLIVVTVVGLISVACANSGEATKGGKTASDEQKSVQTGFNNLSDSQQIPTFKWSQERQTVIDVETIRASGTTSTTSGYLEGVGLIWWCPSAGAPVPSTYQLSASKQWVDLPGDNSRQLYDVDQGEPTGVYIGPSTGTWTICLDDNGKKFAKYWEGYVDSTVGVVKGLPPEKRVRVDQPTFQFTERPPGK